MRLGDRLGPKLEASVIQGYSLGRCRGRSCHLVSGWMQCSCYWISFQTGTSVFAFPASCHFIFSSVFLFIESHFHVLHWLPYFCPQLVCVPLEFTLWFFLFHFFEQSSHHCFECFGTSHPHGDITTGWAGSFWRRPVSFFFFLIATCAGTYISGVSSLV